MRVVSVRLGCTRCIIFNLDQGRTRYLGQGHTLNALLLIVIDGGRIHAAFFQIIVYRFWQQCSHNIVCWS